MFDTEIETLMDNCMKELKTSNIPSIKKALKGCKKLVGEEYFDIFILKVVQKFVSVRLLTEIPAEVEENLLLDIIEEERTFFKNSLKTYRFHISLNGLNDKLYRVIEIPATTTLDDLSHMILTLFKVDASHLFCFNIKGTRYVCDAEVSSGGGYEFEEDTMDVSIADFNFRKNSKFTFTYDYGDNFEFTIQLIGTGEQSPENFTYINIIEGDGYGIWEDCHYEMDLFYSNRKAFNSFVRTNGIDPDFYPTRAKFNLNKTRQSFDEEFITTKIAYEDDFFDEDFEDEEDLDWDLFDEEFEEDEDEEEDMTLFS